MTPTQENLIAELSYQIWESEGKPDGKHLQHWFQAVAELDAISTPKKPSTNARRRTAAKSQAAAKPKRSKPVTRKA